MSVLVTGGAGYIGSHMVWQLCDAGEAVVVLDNLATGFAWAVAPEATFVEGDCGDIDLIGRLIAEHRVEAIIHFAGSVVVPESVVDPLSYYLNNTSRARNLIEAAVKGKVGMFIFSSTAAVYGTPEQLPVAETAPLRPQSPYGRSKLMVETILADAAAAHDFRYVALRYFNVAGADPAGRAGQSTEGATHLIKVACETALGKREALTVHGTDYPTADGTCVRDYIHVSDLVAAHAGALRHLRAGGESLVANCGYGHGFSVLEVIDAVKRVSSRDFEVVKGERRAGDAVAVVASPTFIKERLGWAPRHDDLDAMIGHALAWEASLSRRNRREPRSSAKAPEANPFFANRLLASLPKKDLSRLSEFLEPVNLPSRKRLAEVNWRMQEVYFLEAGIASVVVKDTRGQDTEAGIIGCDGMTGVDAVLGVDRPTHEIMMLVAGRGYRIKIADFNRALKEIETLDLSCRRYVHALLLQTSFTALANGRNNVEVRLARWLLMAQDRLGGDQVALTHDFLAIMLGVRRPGVALALGLLEKAGLIRLGRGQIRLVDRSGLIEAACGSYGIAEAHYGRMFQGPCPF